MRYILSFIVLLAVSPAVHASKTVSGVVAVSTGPMQAFTQSIGRELTAGDDVFMNDEIETGATTRAQVLLRDESVFSLAPASKIIFDEFVYDPLAGEGSLQANLLKGGMRFVSGQLSKSQPENISIKAGEATVGIRGTEIMAKHGDQGTTFVLLSGAMEITTDVGRQLIDRPGFGVDVTSDGLLGAVRQVPLAEINAILAPPPKKDEGRSADSEGASEDMGNESADSEEDGDSEETASGSESDAAASESESQDSASSEAVPAATESNSEVESSFDAALAASVGGSDGESGAAGLSDIAAPTGEMLLSDAFETEASVEIDITSDVIASVVDSLAEDEQKERAEEVIGETLALTLTLTSEGTLTSRPYFSSSANLLVRSASYFETAAPVQFNVTHSLIREKFPDSFDGDSFANHTGAQSNGIDLTSYDAILIYLGAGDDENFSADELADYRSFTHSLGKKVLTLGRSETDMGTINSALPIYHNGVDGYQYTGETGEVNDPQELSPVVGSTSSLVWGVTDFAAHSDDSLFQIPTFRRDLVADLDDTEIDVVNGLLTNVNGDYPALDFGDKGAVFVGRWVCGANGTANGYMGASIDANFVDNGRTQFCRNLISSIAPDASLIDVEVGSLSVSGDFDTASYRIVSGGDDNFTILGDKLLLRGGANLDAAGPYNLVIGVTPTGGSEIERTVSIAVKNGEAETRHIATRDTYHIGETVSFPTENLASHVNHLDDISWVSIGSASGDGQPTDTGIITLHYRVTENGSTYDRFHEIEVVHDCSSDHCDAFATSMNTESELIFNRHFDESNRSSWQSFFTRFSTGTLNLHREYIFSSSEAYDESGTIEPYLAVLNANYSHSLAVNFGTETGALNTAGTFDGVVNDNDNSADFDMTWNFSFTDGAGPCDSSGSCFLNVSDVTDDSETHNLKATNFGSPSDLPGVGLMNMALPNGKHSVLVRSKLATDHAEGCDSSSQCRMHNTDFQPMTPQ